LWRGPLLLAKPSIAEKEGGKGEKKRKKKRGVSAITHAGSQNINQSLPSSFREGGRKKRSKRRKGGRV